MTRKIEVHEVCRVEGHGRILVEISGNQVEKVLLNVFEGPRFFEAVLRGRRYDVVPSIAERICAICSIGHNLTSVLAIEDAFGVKVSKQTELLRELLFHGMMIESHVLHTYFLALPDFLKYPSAIAMVPEYPEEVTKALQMKKLANDIQELLGGKAIHPENSGVGGFSKIPTKDQLAGIKERLGTFLPDAVKTVKIFGSLTHPAYGESPTRFFALKPRGNSFSYFGDVIRCSDGTEVPVKEYRRVCDEKTVSHSSAKHSLPGGEPFMVGSLARVNQFHELLTPKAKAALEEIPWKPPSDNTLYNSLAQAIENLYSFERSIEIIDELLSMDLVENDIAPVQVKAGRGIAATEVPRGTLYHDYEFDDEGKLVNANIVTPTAQNLANVEKDMRTCVTRIIDRPDDEIAFNLEMIVRAYDPCISCSAHFVEVRRK